MTLCKLIDDPLYTPCALSAGHSGDCEPHLGPPDWKAKYDAERAEKESQGRVAAMLRDVVKAQKAQIKRLNESVDGWIRALSATVHERAEAVKSYIDLEKSHERHRGILLALLDALNVRYDDFPQATDAATQKAKVIGCRWKADRKHLESRLEKVVAERDALSAPPSASVRSYPDFVAAWRAECMDIERHLNREQIGRGQPDGTVAQRVERGMGELRTLRSAHGALQDDYERLKLVVDRILAVHGLDGVPMPRDPGAVAGVVRVACERRTRELEAEVTSLRATLDGFIADEDEDEKLETVMAERDRAVFELKTERGEGRPYGWEYRDHVWHRPTGYATVSRVVEEGEKVRWRASRGWPVGGPGFVPLSDTALEGIEAVESAFKDAR